jgi:hypothetical protein
MAWRISKGGTDWSPWSVWPAVRGQVGAAQPVGADSYTCTLAPSTYKTGAGVAWGPEGGPAYGNGRIPLTALAHPAQAPTAWFRPDAAAAFDRLSAAYAARFGHPLRVTDSYRDYAHQVSTKAEKGYLAAKPGTSNHGWGLAADLAIGGYGSADYQWLKAQRPRVRVEQPQRGLSRVAPSPSPGTRIQPAGSSSVRVLWVEWYDFNTEGGPPQVDLHLADGETLRVVSSVDKILAALQGEERTQYVRQERAT